MKNQNNEDEKADSKDENNTGFEKFLKRTRKSTKSSDGANSDQRPATEPIGDDNEDKTEDPKEEDDKKEDDKKMKSDAEKDDADLTEDEAENEKEKKEESKPNALTDFFMDPKGNKPKWENIGLVGFLAGAFGFYMFTRGEPSQEITFNELIYDFIPQNQVTMITIAEDKAGEVFKYRAQIELTDGKRVHIILPNV